MASKLLGSLNAIICRSKFSNGLENKQNYSKISSLKSELEHSFNCQINTEFFASFTYLAMVSKLLQQIFDNYSARLNSFYIADLPFRQPFLAGKTFH